MVEASREIFWNIQYSWIMYVLAAISVAIMVWALIRIPRRWRVGKPANRWNHLPERLRAFCRTAFVDIIFHRKFFGADKKDGRLKEKYAGLMHFLIFSGFVVFFIATVLDAVSHYTIDFMHDGFYLGYSVVSDSFGILAIIGILLALYRRYIWKPKRLDNRFDDLGTLLLILVVIVTGFIVEGLRISVTELVQHPDWAVWSPGGWVFAKAFYGAADTTLRAWHVGLWWFHVILSLITIAYISFFNTKLFHIIWDPVNIFFRNLGPKGAMEPIDLEKTEHFGADKIEDFTWKQLMDLDACTRCGRCQDACPAYASGKLLNPKAVIQDLKNHLYEVYPAISHLKAPEKRKEMLGEVIKEEVVWDCTTCRACMQACPIFIEHVPKLLDMRRNLAMEKSKFPEAAQQALQSLGTRGHPYRGTSATRMSWCEGLDVPTVDDAKAIDVLYWVGCSAALEDRNMKVAQATVKVLKAAGIKFAILGDEETCCGDPARRMGDEYLFQTICQQNIEIFKAHNVKKIITTCPHCFNSLKHEYPQFGGNYEVIHHSQFLAGLLNEGRIKLNYMYARNAVYHDSCYLGRYNDIYEEPRGILRAVNLTNRELPRRKTASFCCGGGGGHIWMEEDPEKRVNVKRIEEVIKAGADCVATACPYCLSMFEDGLKTKGAEEKVKAMDLAELLLMAIEGDKAKRF